MNHTISIVVLKVIWCINTTAPFIIKKELLTNHSGGQGIQACDLWGEVIIVGEGADGRLTHVSQQHRDRLWSHSSLK